MSDVEIVLQRQVAHLGIGQHGRVFAGAIISIRSWLFVPEDQCFERLHVARHMHAALQSCLIHADLFLDAFHGLYMQVTAFVGGAGDRKLARREAIVFDTATLDKRKHLKGLGAGA